MKVQDKQDLHDTPAFDRKNDRILIQPIQDTTFASQSMRGNNQIEIGTGTFGKLEGLDELEELKAENLQLRQDLF